MLNFCLSFLLICRFFLAVSHCGFRSNYAIQHLSICLFGVIKHGKLYLRLNLE